LAKVVEVHTGRISFVKVSDRSTSLFAVPVPSSRGRALLLFASRSRGRGRRRWWSPTLALSGRLVLTLAEALRGDRRGLALRSKTGLFVAVRRRGSELLLLLGAGGRPFATVRLTGGDAAKLSSMLERALTWPPAELPSPLSWRAKERIFGQHAS